MNLRDIEAFVMLADILHFTRAAELLGIGQPQISQRIRRFEKACGAPLVERTTRTVTLTPAGRAVLPHAQNALEALRLINRAVSESEGKVIGTVRLGYAGASSRPWLPAIARTVRQESPGINLQMRSMIYAAAGPGMIVSGDLDICFSRRPLVHSGLREEVFEYEQLLVGLPSDHPLANQSAIEMTDLEREPWVSFPAHHGSTVRQAGEELAAEAGFIPSVVQEAPDSYTILGLVAAGVGVTITLSSLQHVSTPGLTFVPLAGEPRYMTATVVWSNQASQATLEVLEAIRGVRPQTARPQGIFLE